MITATEVATMTTLSPAVFNKVYSFIRCGKRKPARIISMNASQITVEWIDTSAHAVLPMGLAVATIEEV